MELHYNVDLFLYKSRPEVAQSKNIHSDYKSLTPCVRVQLLVPGTILIKKA